jgi:hypothetical protein
MRATGSGQTTDKVPVHLDGEGAALGPASDVTERPDADVRTKVGPRESPWTEARTCGEADAADERHGYPADKHPVDMDGEGAALAPASDVTERPGDEELVRLAGRRAAQ